MRYGPKNLAFGFTVNNLTHFGGVYLLSQFFKQIHLRRQLSRHVIFSQRNNWYTTTEEVMALLFPIALGMGRIETTQMLQYNGAFLYLTGLPRFPHPTTLRRFLLRMAPVALSRLRNLHDKLLLSMMVKPRPPAKIILDLDSTVLTLYGKQEMARKGYNPFKPGRRSYHPLLCFNGLTHDFWHGELRPGDVYTARGTIELLQASFAKVPPSAMCIIIRADKGFYDHKTIEYIESEQALFVIVAKLSQPIKRRLSSLRYRTYASGLQTTEFFYQPAKWTKKHRFIVIRRPIPQEPSDQLTLFSLDKFSYQVLVTNLSVNPLNVWRFYNQRAAVELTIKELKADYPLAKIPTKHFAANEAYFHLLLLSYNLINWFKRLCLPKEFQAMTLSTLRHQLLMIPALLTNAGNRPTLKLPVSYPYQTAFFHAAKRIQKISL